MTTDTVVLPRTLDQFAAQLELLDFDECPICLESYHEYHVAARPPKCKHVIGHPCLPKWLREGMNHRYPVFRTLLYQIYDDEDENAHVGFIQHLWAALCKPTLRSTLALTFSWLILS
jgi:hypothetical protein